MNIHLKVIISVIVLAALGLAASFGIGALLKGDRTTEPAPTDNEGEPQTPPTTEGGFADATQFPSQTFTLDEGYSIELVDGWELVAKTPNRRVDRYRFERTNDKESIFTISLYDRSTVTSFDDLVQARYGGAYLREQQDVTVNGLPAKRVSADFLDMGATIDVLVAADDNTYISLYGIHAPDGSTAAEITKQINFMQKSFRVMAAQASTDTK